MNRRKVCSLAVAFLLGIAAVEYDLLPLWCILILYGCIWIYSMHKEYKESIKVQIFWIVLFFSIVFAGGCNSYSQNAFRETYASLLKDNEICQVQGEIYQKEQDNKGYLYYLKDCKMQLNQKNYSCNQILVILEAEEYSIGEILCVEGKIKTYALPTNEGSYNERAYYYSLKMDFQLEATKVLGVYGEKSDWKELLYVWKGKIKKSFQNAMPEADAGVLTAMVLGDKSLMDKERKAMYQDAGISHFYSISGVKIQNLVIPLIAETRINRAFVPLHIAKIHILKLCFNEEIIPRCRFPCSRG